MKFVTGHNPLLTRGSLAKFFGGDELFEQLDDRKPNTTFAVVFLLSLMFQVAMWLYKKFKNYRLKSFSTYMVSLRKNLGKKAIMLKIIL